MSLCKSPRRPALTRKGDAGHKPAAQGHLIDCGRAVSPFEIGLSPDFFTLLRPPHPAESFSRPEQRIEVRDGKKGIPGKREDAGGSEIDRKGQHDWNG